MSSMFENEILFSTELPIVIILLRIFGAGLLGALLGLERELHDRNAGLRTHTLISIAAASLAILTIEITLADYLVRDTSQLDPLRVIEAVTAGVAFLAAGAIIQSRGNVRGLTTGAGMWLAGVIGLAAGMGHWAIAGVATVAGIFILSVMRWVEIRAGLKDEEADTRQ